MKLNIDKKTFATIAAILLGGALLLALILVPGRETGTTDEHQMEEVASSGKEKEHGHAGEEEEAHVRPDGTVVIDAAQMKAAGIATASAAPATLGSSLQLAGEIKFDQDRTAHVVPRLEGVVQSVSANLGQQVKGGQVLATIASVDLAEMRSELLAAQKRQSIAAITYERERTLWQEKISAEQDYLQAQQVLREAEIATQNAAQKLTAVGASLTGRSSLNRYEIRAPFTGSVVEKHIAQGEAVKEDANVFLISDLSSVWAEIIVPAKDLGTVRVGEKATVKAASMNAEAVGKVSYVGSLLGEETRSATARVTLPNPDGAWRPGLFVDVVITSDERKVPVTVTSEAVQTLEERSVVFVRTKDGFLARPVVTGRSDGRRTEIVSGIAAGTEYAAKGSFVLKAELGKGSAEHEH